MTYFTTWPTSTGPQYAPHDTEAQAEAHATEIVTSGRARVATVFQIDQPTEETK